MGFPNLQIITKVGGNVHSRGGGVQIQESIDTCIGWAKDWQMQFNLRKCKVLEMVEE